MSNEFLNIIINVAILIVGYLKFQSDNRKLREADLDRWNQTENNVNLLKQRLDINEKNIDEKLETIYNIVKDMQTKFYEHTYFTKK